MPRIFMHKAAHGILTIVMLFLAYSFADEMPTFNGNPSFRAMAELMPESGWAVSCALVGAIGLVTVLTENWKIRTVSSAVLGTAHFVIAVLIWMGNKHAIGTGLFFGYGALGLALVYSTAHLGQRISEDLDPFNIP